DADKNDRRKADKQEAVRRANRMAGAKSSITFTSHAGAKVYLDVAVTDPAVLQSKNAPQPFAVSPFLRKEIGAGVHNIFIVPGDGAMVAGDAEETGPAAVPRAGV